MVVLATTTLPEDDELAALGEDLGLGRGSGRSTGHPHPLAAGGRQLGIDLLVTCDGDDVFCDPEYVDRVIRCHLETGADYIRCVGLPFGHRPIGISRAALTRVCEAKQETNTEGQGRFFEDPRLVSSAEVEADPEVRHPTARLTLDLEDDARAMEAIIAELDDEADPNGFGLAEIVELLRQRPDIVAINEHLQEAIHAALPRALPAGVADAVSSIEIAGRQIGEGAPVYVIAEIGVNHDGSVERARALVEAAAAAGADAVKLQTFEPEALATADAPLAAYQRSGSEADSQREMLEQLTLSDEDLRDLAALCRRSIPHFLSTPFDEASAERLAALDVPAFKVSFGKLTNLPSSSPDSRPAGFRCWSQPV